MQALKDSFYIALRDRLAARYPERKVLLGGEECTAIVVVENERLAAPSPLPEVFHLNWSKAKCVTADEPAALMSITCTVSYSSEGTEALNAQDRGRTLAAMDAELLDISRPGRTEIEDYAQAPPANSGMTLFWSPPAFGDIDQQGARLSRTATLELFAIFEGGA